MAVVMAVTTSGKFTPMSPIFTAIVPMYVAIILSGAQLFVNLVLNRFFAKANVFLMNLQLFHIAQLCSLVPLLWNSPEYLYDWRIWRYISFFLATLFCLIYNVLLIDIANLIIVKSIFNK